MPSYLKKPSPSPLVKVNQEKVEYSLNSLFQVVEAQVQYRRFNGKMGRSVTRINFERGDAVAMLLYDPKSERVILARQFRYPVYASLTDEQKTGVAARKAWLLETFAGMIDPGRTALEMVNKELMEESGYQMTQTIEPVATFYVSPGGTSERIVVYIVEVQALEKVSQGGGVIAEDEDIQIVDLPFAVAMAMIQTGEICDAKTIIALQHLALKKSL